MPPTSPDRVVLTDTQRGNLDRLVRAGRTEQRLALRADTASRNLGYLFGPVALSQARPRLNY